jgi:hypothetical protein
MNDHPSINVASDGVNPDSPNGQQTNIPKRRRTRSEIREQILSYDPTRNYQASRYPYYSEIFVQQLPLWRLWTARLMLASDPVINFSLNLRNSALMAADVVPYAKSEEVQDWLFKQWHVLWNKNRTKMVSAKKWGYAPLQCLFRQDSRGIIHIAGLKDFAPEDCRALEYRGRLCGMSVRGQNVFQPQALWLTFNSEFGSRYGLAVTKRQYPAWYEKWMEHGAKRLVQLRMIKDAYIGDIFWYPPNISIQMPDGTRMSWRDLMREIGENRLSGGVMTLPKFYDQQGKELTGYTPPQQIPGMTEIFTWVEHCDDNILKGADIPLEVIRASSAGSGFSGRSIPFLVMLSVCNNELTEIVQDVVEQVLRPLAWLNWGKDVEFDLIPLNLVESFAKDISASELGGSVLGGGFSKTPRPDRGENTGTSAGGDQEEKAKDDPLAAFASVAAGKRLHAPPEGIIIDGKYFPGGQFLPKKVVQKLIDELGQKNPSPDVINTAKKLIRDNAPPATSNANATTSSLTALEMFMK